MFIELIFSFLFGILCGTITGLTPGIHINLIATTIISIPFLTTLNKIYLIIFLTSMAVTHTFVDFIPSVFLGCPDTDTELSVLPGHTLLKNKKGYEAVYLSNIGSISSLFLFLILIIPSFLFLKKFYELIEIFIPYILLVLILILLVKEKHKIKALFIFLLTGIFAILLNNFEINQPLFPLLTGLFGGSNLILSIKNKTTIPSQIIKKPNISIKKPLLKSLLISPLCCFLPGFGNGQAALLGSLNKKINQKEFLVLLGSINTLVMSFSFLVFFLIQKTRTGITKTFEELTSILTNKEMILLVFATLFSGIFAFYITEKFSKIFAKNIEKISYEILSKFVLLILLLIIFIISNFKGIFIFIFSTLIGIMCIKLKVKRTNMMGCLILPTIFWLLVN